MAGAQDGDRHHDDLATTRVGTAIYSTVVFLSRAFIGARGRVTVTSDSSLPDGPLLIAGNHLCFVDPFVLGPAVDKLGRRARYMGKVSVFKTPVVGTVVRSTGMIPVDRGNDPAQALEPAATELRRGGCVGIYPEGTTTRHRDFWPEQSRTGVARLALMSGATIVPVAQWGTQDLLGHGGLRDLVSTGFRLRRRPITVRAGTPIVLTGDPDDREAVEAGTARVAQALIALVADLRGEPPPAYAGQRCGRRDGTSCPCEPSGAGR
jgi:1-acyl-sn-glycerol-3-phosphate acyltransferase